MAPSMLFSQNYSFLLNNKFVSVHTTPVRLESQCVHSVHTNPVRLVVDNKEVTNLFSCFPFYTSLKKILSIRIWSQNSEIFFTNFLWTLNTDISIVKKNDAIIRPKFCSKTLKVWNTHIVSLGYYKLKKDLDL